MSVARRLFHALVNNWPQKLGAFGLAVLLWLFVAVNDTSITQRSLFVPIRVEGLAESSVATGLPEFVEVTVSGGSVQIDRLRPENFEAILDLAGQTGSFEVPVRVLSPQAIDLLRVSPSDVIGTVEALTEASIPVQTALLGPAPADVRVAVGVEPQTLTARGRSSTLAQVAQALVPVRASPGQREVVPFAADATGHPVAGVVLAPQSVTVTVSEEPVEVTRSLPLDVAPPVAPPYVVTMRLDAEEVTVTGPPSVLDDLQAVPGTVEFATEPQGPGSYTLQVNVELPEGVRQLTPRSATVRLERPPVTD